MIDLSALQIAEESLNQLSVPPGQIMNITGSTSPCGAMPDVYGNNAYFNSICTNPGGSGGIQGVAGLIGNTVAQPLPNGTLYTVTWNQSTVQALGFNGTLPLHQTATAGVYDGFIIQQAGFYAWQAALSFAPATGTVVVTPIALETGSAVPISGNQPFALATDSVIEYPLFQYYAAGRIIGAGVTAQQAGTSIIAAAGNNLVIALIARLP